MPTHKKGKKQKRELVNSNKQRKSKFPNESGQSASDFSNVDSAVDNSGRENENYADVKPQRGRRLSGDEDKPPPPTKPPPPPPPTKPPPSINSQQEQNEDGYVDVNRPIAAPPSPSSCTGISTTPEETGGKRRRDKK